MRYREAGLPILQSYGAEILVAEENAEAREGEPGQHTVVVKFPSMEAANAFMTVKNTSGWCITARTTPRGGS